DRHDRNCAPRNEPEQREQDAREYIAARGPSACAYRLARAAHVRRIDWIAGHFQGEVGLDRCAHVEGAVAKKRPATVLALNAAQIDRNLRLERYVDRLAEIVAQENVFCRDGGIGFQLEYPVPIGLLQCQERAGRCLDAAIEACRGCWFLLRGYGTHDARLSGQTRSAARNPERTAPSMVAGNPVSVQAPARNRLRHAVFAAGRLAFSAGVAAKVARRSRTICHGGMALGRRATAATSCQMFLASSSRGVSSRRSAALMVTASRSLKP